jgi:transcriptional regulator with XRE-family HTH domain
VSEATSPEDEKAAFGKQLQALHLERGWSQSELARRAGLSRDKISTYVRGECLPRQLQLRALAKALEVSPDELLPGSRRLANGNGPEINVRLTGQGAQSVWLQVNQVVSLSAANKILAILEAEAQSAATDPA